MKIEIRSRGVRLTKKQTSQLQQDLGFVFARFGRTIGRVIVAVAASGSTGLTSCEVDVQVVSRRVTAVCSDSDVLVAASYAARRTARSISRAIDLEGLMHR
jgi:hypothetical protein